MNADADGMQFRTLVQRAVEIRGQYAELEQRTFGTSWTSEQVALGFVGDVGDLMKLVLAQGGVRDIPDAKRKLAHELVDCLWSILVLAHAHGIDLEEAFLETMDDLERHLASELRSSAD